MVMTRGTERDVYDMVATLVELDLDAVDAYKAAITRLRDPRSKLGMGGFLADHQRHVTELSSFMRRANLEPPAKGDFKRLLSRGKVFIGQLAGDRGILTAMRSNENDTNQAYERAVLRDDLPPDLRDILTRGMADERRHREWIEDRIDKIQG